MLRNTLRQVVDDRAAAVLETAIILIAYAVVAAVFAFTMLSSGASANAGAMIAVPWL